MEILCFFSCCSFFIYYLGRKYLLRLDFVIGSWDIVVNKIDDILFFRIFILVGEDEK